MHTLSPIIPQAAHTGVYHLEDKSRGWVEKLSQQTIIFYAKPFIQKWLRVFKQPDMLIVSDAAVDEALWKQKFKTPTLTVMSMAEALAQAAMPPRQWECLVVLQPDLSASSMMSLAPLLKQSGAFVMVGENQHAVWPALEASLQAGGLEQLFVVGFHPQGAVAWWPWDSPFAVTLGKVVDFVLIFVPGRISTAQRFGRCWLIRGFKGETATQIP